MSTSNLSHVFRFLVVGGLNTAITYAIFLGLTGLLQPWLAYGIAYIVGIGIAFVGNRGWVFKSQRSFSSFIPYIFLQLALMGFGTLISWLLTGLIPLWAVGLGAIASVLPFSFFANRFFFNSHK